MRALALLMLVAGCAAPPPKPAPAVPPPLPGPAAAPAPEPKPEPENEPAAWLEHRETGTRFALAESGVTRIGRVDNVSGERPDVELGGLTEGDTVSRRHAEILRRGDGWVLFIQPTTTNPTWVNGALVAPGTTTELADRDTLQLGGLWLMFRIRERDGR